MDSYHVTHADNQWVLKKASASEVLHATPTKDAMVKALPGLFEGKTASVKIHNADGSFDEERTYPRSADPRGSKG